MQDNRLPQPPSTPRLLQATNTHLMNYNGAADVWELVTLLYVVCVSEHSDSSPFANDACWKLSSSWEGLGEVGKENKIQSLNSSNISAPH